MKFTKNNEYLRTQIFIGLLCFIGWAPVQAIEVEGTGIDWEVSTMQVEFTAENIEVPIFSCFDITPDNCVGSKDSCVITDLDSLGYSDENAAPVIDNCFHQAGDYTVTIELTDFASNTSDPIVSNFTVKAGPPNQDQSSFDVSGCAVADENGNDLEEEVNVANGSDICTFLLKIKDEYGNPVTQLNGQNGKIYTDSDFPLDANRGVSFRNGLRLGGGVLGDSGTATTFTLSNDASVSEQFQLSAWAPSISEVAAYLGKNEAKQLDFNIELFTVDANGSLDTGNTVTFKYGQYSPSVRFRSVARTLLSFINNPEYIIDVETPMRLTRLMTPDVTGVPPVNNPISSFLRTYLRYYNLPVELVFSTDSELYFDPPTTNFHSQYSAGEEVIDINPTLEVAAAEIQFTQLLSFATEVEYDTAIGTIRYPSGALGAGFGVSGDDADDLDSTPVAVRLIGVSIEGNVLSRNPGSQVFADEEHLLLGGVNFKDAREALSKNAASITRGVPVHGGSDLTFTNNWYSNGRVAVVDGDVQIGSSGGGTFSLPDGKNTLVIRNGNLVINGDLDYANETDSFGFILINDTLEPYPEKGNIFIRSGVKNIVGTYFAEGGFMSISDVLPFGSVTLANNNNGSVNNDTQLLLTGTLMTHNTVGGAISVRPPEYDPGGGGNVGASGYEAVCHTANNNTLWVNVSDGSYQNHIDHGDAPGLCLLVGNDESFTNPWGLAGADGVGTTVRSLAMPYDLHYVRQFKPEYPEGGGGQTNTNLCFSNPCDANLNAFVIRVDGKVGTLSPPGFDTLSTIHR